MFLQLPEEALQGFTADPQHFAAAVVDVAMPRLDGPELVRRMLEVRSDLPVLMVSGYIRPEDQRLIEQLGIRELLLKPDVYKQLGDRLASLLGEPTT